MNNVSVKTLGSIMLAVLALSGCARDGDIDPTGGISITRSSCPAVAVPAYTGDMTMFNPVDSTDARAIDVVASITNLRSTCNDSGSDIVVSATFDVLARRTDPTGARDVTLPYFTSVVRGGRAVISKRLGQVTVRFADGETRASASAAGGAVVNRAAATLPEEMRERITRRRKPGDQDAALDPLADPEIRAAVQRTSFEVLFGFQLSQAQLRYNVTR